MNNIMAKRKTDSSPKKGGAGINLHPRLAFHLEQELLDAFDAWRTDTKPNPPISASIREFLREALERRGYWPPKNTS